MTLLSIQNLRVAYGDFVAVHDLSFSVSQGEIFVLLGANGAGKTSVLRCVSGLVAASHGSVIFEGRSIARLRSHQIARAGIAHVPENRRIFPNLTVEENLEVSFIRPRAREPLKQSIERVNTLFPLLAERRRQRAGTMSGGEQQMLAIGRAIMNSPTLLMLDEPSVGLSPLITEQVFQQLSVIRSHGISIVLVEQNASSLDLATRGLILSNGHVLLNGERASLQKSDFVRRAYFGG